MGIHRAPRKLAFCERDYLQLRPAIPGNSMREFAGWTVPPEWMRPLPSCSLDLYRTINVRWGSYLERYCELEQFCCQRYIPLLRRSSLLRLPERSSRHGRLAHDELRFDKGGLRQIVGLDRERERSPSRGLTHALDRLVDRGEGHFQIFGVAQVAAAGEGDVTRDGEAGLHRRLHRADGRQIVVAEDSVWPMLLRQQLLHRAVAGRVARLLKSFAGDDVAFGSLIPATLSALRKPLKRSVEGLVPWPPMWASFLRPRPIRWRVASSPTSTSLVPTKSAPNPGRFRSIKRMGRPFRVKNSASSLRWQVATSRTSTPRFTSERILLALNLGIFLGRRHHQRQPAGAQRDGKGLGKLAKEGMHQVRHHQSHGKRGGRSPSPRACMLGW